jgi:hypothetical protein
MLLAALAIACLYLWGLGAVGFQDPDEGMYAEIAREMLAGKDWWVPRFNAIPYIEKPPLVYWLTAATYAVLGPSEFSARLWKVLPILGTIALTYGLGGRLFSPRVGALSSMVLATSLGLFVFSRITQMDPAFLFGLTLSVYGIAGLGLRSQDGNDRTRRRGSVFLWLGAGIAVMSKGVLGVVLPLALLLLWRLFRHDGGTLRQAWSWRGVVVAAVLVLPWHVVAAWKVPGFFQFYMMDNQIWRFLGTRAYVEDGKSVGTLAFFGVTAFALFPWTPYLVGALSRVLTEGVRSTQAKTGRKALTDWRWGFLAAWFLLVVGLIAVSSFKLEYYALPAFPAAALLVGALLGSAGNRRQGAATPAQQPDSDPTCDAGVALLRRCSWLAFLGGILFVGGVAWGWRAGHFTSRNIIRTLSYWATNYRVLLEQGLPLPPLSLGYFKAVLLGGGLLWVTGYGAALYGLRISRPERATAAVLVVGFGLAVLAGGVLREVGPHHSLKPVAEQLGKILQPGDVLVHERGLERGGGLLFYTRRKALVLNGLRGDLEFGSKLPGYQQAFIDTPKFLELWAGARRVFLVTDLPPARSAISHAHGSEPRVIARTGTRWLYVNQPLAPPTAIAVGAPR